MQRRQTLSQSLYNIDPAAESLSATYLKIKQIDKLKQAKAGKIKVLNISNNLLTKLENIQQFVNLQQIDIRNNIIKNGCELLVLRNLVNLTRVYVDGNPFLLEPLDQDVLEFLIQKQTDIQILSGEDLNRILDLQEGELKVVFLENYLKKLSCHDEILARRGNLSASRRSLHNQQASNHLIINKIMPQFYSIIDSEKIKSKVKKETISLKKQQQITFEDAVKIKKQKQQQQVNTLIKDILLLVEEQDEEKYQSSHYVEEQEEREEPEERNQRQGRQIRQEREEQKKNIQNRQRIGGEEDKSKLRMGKETDLKKEDGQNREKGRKNRDSVDEAVQVDTIPYDKNQWNTNEQFNSTQSFRKKLHRIRGNMNYDSQMQTNRINGMQSTLKSPREINQTEKSVERLTSPRVQDLFSPKNDSYSRSSGASPAVGKFTYNDNFYSFNNTRPMPFNDSTSKSIKNQASNSRFETKKTAQAENIPQQKYSYPQSTRRNQQKAFPQPSLQQQLSQKTASQLYEQYYLHLTKYNPTFALLYSQIQSLSSEEKQVLIEALAKDHKNKTIQLFIQRNKVKNLKTSATENASQHERQKYEAIMRISEIEQNLFLCKQYNEKLQKQNDRIVGLLKVVSQDMGELKEDNNKLKDNLDRKNKQVSNLNKDLRNKIVELQNLDASEDIGQTIEIAHNQRLKSKYFNIINKRAIQHSKIESWKQKREQKERKKLLNLSWSLLKKHLLIHILAKMKAKQSQNSILKVAFKQWKYFTGDSKKIKETQSKVLQIIKKKNLLQFKSTTKRRIQRKKQRKLHNFWADHHLQKKYFYGLIKKVKESKLSEQQKMKISVAHHKKYKLKNIFRSIYQLKTRSQQQISASIKAAKDMRKDVLFQKMRKRLISSYIKKQRNQKVKAIGRILQYTLEDKNKRQFLRLLGHQRQKIKLLESQIMKKKKSTALNALIANIKKSRKGVEDKNKTRLLMKKLAWNRFHTKITGYLKFLNKFKKVLRRGYRKNLYYELKIDRKQMSLERDLKVSRIKQFLKELQKNSYEQKLTELQIKQRIEQEQTKQLLQKMRALQEMQLQAIKLQHNKQLQILEEEEIRKQIEYRNQIIDIENQKKQLEDKIWVMKKDIEEMRERENLFFKEKQLIEEQVKIAEHGNKQMTELNANLQSQIDSINVKYQRVLELYTQAVIHLEKKDKISENMVVFEKQRDKTVEKDKRHVGLAKNGQFSSLRNRVH